MNDDTRMSGERSQKISYSQNFEDVYIDRVFSDVDCGFYIDIGAYHPIFDSVTKYFYDKGWCGINVEPGPHFDSLTCRERDTNVKAAVSDSSGQKTFIFFEDTPGMSRLADASSPDTPRGLSFTVDCMTLEELVAKYASGRHIHFLKLDIEGADAAVVMSTDWRRMRPELLVVESTIPMTNTRCDGQWRSHLTEMGFHEVFFDGINVYYLRTESMFRAKCLDRPVNVLDGFEKRTRADYELDDLKRHYTWLSDYRYKLEADIARESESKNRCVAWLSERLTTLKASLDAVMIDLPALTSRQAFIQADVSTETLDFKVDRDCSSNNDTVEVNLLATLEDILMNYLVVLSTMRALVGQLVSESAARATEIGELKARGERWAIEESDLRAKLLQAEADRDLVVAERRQLSALASRQETTMCELKSELHQISGELTMQRTIQGTIRYFLQRKWP